MKGLITIMMIILFTPVVCSIYILYKRLHEEPKDNGAREILLQAMCLEELKKKKNEDASTVNTKTSDIITDISKNDFNEEQVRQEDKKDNSYQEKSDQSDKNEITDIDDDIKKSIKIAKESLFSQEDQKKKDDDQKNARKKAAADMVFNMMMQKGKSGASKEELQEMINVLSDKNK